VSQIVVNAMDAIFFCFAVEAVVTYCQENDTIRDP